MFATQVKASLSWQGPTETDDPSPTVRDTREGTVQIRRGGGLHFCNAFGQGSSEHAVELSPGLAEPSIFHESMARFSATSQRPGVK